MGVCDSILAIDTTTHEVAAAVKIDGKFLFHYQNPEDESHGGNEIWIKIRLS
jgi:hypothetical protein